MSFLSVMSVICSLTRDIFVSDFYQKTEYSRYMRVGGRRPDGQPPHVREFRWRGRRDMREILRSEKQGNSCQSVRITPV